MELITRYFLECYHLYKIDGKKGLILRNLKNV
jgi:hypothetical protein